MQRVIRVVNWLSNGFAFLAAPLTGIIALLVLYEVFCRYFINAATSWTAEMESYLQIALVMMGGAYVLNKGGHVRVDVLYRQFSGRKKQWVEILTSLTVLLATSPMVWFGGGLAWDAWATGQTSSSAAELLLWPSMAAVPLGAGLLALQSIVKGLSAIMCLKEMGRGSGA
jgi:TRAP-type mannitol/chloroaromatic compound transport system permease small subunit